MPSLLTAEELTALERWAVPKFDYISDAAIAEVRNHPRFGEAMRHIFVNVLDHAGRDKAHASVFHDLQRFVLGMLVLYLDVTGGVTHRRLRELGSEGGMMSSGRATAILMHMRAIGYVVPVAQGATGRVRLYEATPALYETFQDRMRFEFEAAAMIEPGVARLIANVADRPTFRAICTHLGETLRYATRGARPDFALVERIASRRAGMPLLCLLFLMLDDGSNFPCGGQLSVNIQTVSDRLGVSRGQTLKILRELENGGQYSRSSHGDTLSDTFADTFARYYAALLVGVLYCCVLVIKEIRTDQIKV